MSNNKNFIKLKAPLLQRVIKWLLAIFVFIVTVIFVLNVFVTYIILNLTLFSSRIVPTRHDGYIQAFVGDNLSKSIDFWKNKEKYTFDYNTGGPSRETVNSLTKDKTYGGNSVRMRHFYVNALRYGGTSDRLSTYILTSEDPSINASGKFDHPWVTLVTGYLSDWSLTFETSEMFLRMGYNCMIFDNQGVSQNTKDAFGYLGSKGGKTTFGERESIDLHAIMSWFEDTHNPINPNDIENSPIYTTDGTNYKYYWNDANAAAAKMWVSGESMGATTALMYGIHYGGKDQKPNTQGGLNIQGVVADSGFGDLLQEIYWIGWHYFGIPVFLLKFGLVFWYQNLTGYSVYSNKIFNKIKNWPNQLPVLVIHTDGDDYVPFDKNFYQIFSGLNADHKYNYVVHGPSHLFTIDWEYLDSWIHFDWNDPDFATLLAKGPYCAKLIIFGMPILI